MAYYIKSETVVRGNPHGMMMREIIYNEHTEQTEIKTKIIGIDEVKCTEEVFDGDREDEFFDKYMEDGIWKTVPAHEFNEYIPTSFEEINDENKGIVTRRKKHVK